jgi:DNA-binding CsgD family transcriptional regulator
VSSDAVAGGSAVSPVALPGPRPGGDGDASTADVHDAARRLLAVVRRLPAEPSGNGIVLDLVVDGARCVVTRAKGTAGHDAGHADVPVPGQGSGRGNGASVGPLPPGGLTPREQEIARMVADGFTNKEIASVLEISSWTVSTHLRRIFGKLDVGTRAAMVARLSPPFRS